VGSSRVPAGGEVSSKVPAKGVVRCQRPELGGGRRKDREWASQNRQRAIARAFGTTTGARQARDVTNRAFPHQRHKPSKSRPS